uniref:Uncharacterized protein n=1 Tax=Scleropages formosus TaxID=113540 RepID=A0A8C9RZG6_SCLFO
LLLTRTSRFEQQDGHLAQVEVDEMLRLVGDITSKIPPHNAMPSGIVLLSYLLDICSNVLLDVVLLQSLGRALHGILLHLLRHVSILNHCLPVRHGCPEGDTQPKALTCVLMFSMSISSDFQ